MKVKEYRASPGSRLRDSDASRIGSFLEKEFGDDGPTPDDVVRVAKPKRSPIHGYFEWDDGVAGAAYRRTQALYLLRSIEVVFVNDEERGPTKAFHRVVVERPSGVNEVAYVPARIVWENESLSSQVVEQARRELISWQARYSRYKELAAVAAHVDAAVEQMSLV